MHAVKPVLALSLLLGSLYCAGAGAMPPPPRQGGEPPAAAVPVPPSEKNAPEKNAPEKDASDKAVAPAQPAKKAPPKRRAVPQIIDSMQPRASSAAPPGPVTNQPPPFNPVTAPMPNEIPAPPVPIGSCDGGGCTDINGTRLNRGSGNILLNPQGRVCHQTGASAQCM